MTYIACSTPKKKVQAHFLALCPPEVAYQWLSTVAPKSADEARAMRYRDVPDLAEYILLRRKDPLIDLGLAKFGRTPRAVRGVVSRGGAAVRIAAWSNIGSYGPFMTDIWATELDITKLVSNGSKAEIQSLASNASLSDSMISDLIVRKDAFANMTDERWHEALTGLAENLRLQEEYDADGFLDGAADYFHHEVFKDVWKLAETLPATQEAARLLNPLLRRCKLPLNMNDEAANLIERWRIDREREPESTYYNPGASFYLRTRLADLLQADETLLDSQDRALRYSYWRRFDPKKNLNWPSDMEQVFKREDERDAYATLNEALGNDLLWKRQKERDLLRELCWAAPDSKSYMDMPNSYRAFERSRRLSNPDWFEGLPMGIGKDALRVPDEGEPRWASEILLRVVRLEGLHHRSQLELGRREMTMAMSETEAREDQQAKQTSARTSWWAATPGWVWLFVGAAIAYSLR